MEQNQQNVRSYVRYAKTKKEVGDKPEVAGSLVFMWTMLIIGLPGFAATYPAQTFAVVLLAVCSIVAWRKRWEILALRRGFVLAAVESPQEAQPKKKRHYERRLKVHDYQTKKAVYL